MQMISSILSDMWSTPAKLIKPMMDYKREDYRYRKKEANEIAKDYKDGVNYSNNTKRL